MKLRKYNYYQKLNYKFEDQQYKNNDPRLLNLNNP